MMELIDQAVARGDLSETIDVEASGEIAELKTTVNGMVSAFSGYEVYMANDTGDVSPNIGR